MTPPHPDTPAPVRANDIVIFRASRWRVVLVKTGNRELREPTRVRLMRVVEVDLAEVVPTGETLDTRRAAQART